MYVVDSALMRPDTGQTVSVRTLLPVTTVSFFYFFCILAAYYTIRPVKDMLAVEDGVERLPLLYLATLITMLFITPVYGWLTQRFPRRQFVPMVYLFFILNLLGFYAWFQWAPDSTVLRFAFFVWTSCFSLFVVSVFWSVMADVHDQHDARLTFGIIAAGGSLGAICGDQLTRSLVTIIGTGQLPFISILFLMAALILVNLLFRMQRSRPVHADAVSDQPIGGSLLAGARLILDYRFLRLVAIFMCLGTFTGALIYSIQGSFISTLYAGDRDGMTQIFASINLWGNLITLLFQVGLSWWLLKHVHLKWVLSILPVLVIIGFALFIVLPIFPLIVIQQIIRRSTLYGITNPAIHLLYTNVGPESKYKFKNFTETAVWRAGDVLASSLFLLFYLYSNLPLLAGVGLLVAIAWLWLTRRMIDSLDEMKQRQELLP